MLNNQQLKEFFYSLFGQCADCKLGTMTLPNKQIQHYLPEQLDQLIADGQRLGAVCNTYFDVNPKIRSLKDGLRGGSETVQYLCSLYADIDVFGPAHKEKHLPETKDAALEHLRTLPMQPTYVIDTGYGLQAYWVLEKPLRLDSQDDWMKGDGILKGYGQFLTDHFAQKGWKLDPVFDLARMLRFPGSYNFKLDAPVRGDFLVFGGPQYTIEDFFEYMAPPVVVEKKTFEVDERGVGSADRIMQRCQIARQMLDDPDSVSEPLWYALCCNSVLTPDGVEKFHEWSSNYTGYDYDETEAKIVRAQATKAPCTCEYFKSRLGCQCPEGGCGVKAPIVHALLSKDEQLQNLLSKTDLDVDEVLDKYSLGLLYYAMENRPAEYLKFKMRVRKMGISIKDFERAVKSEAPKPEPPEFDDLPQAIQLDGLDLHDAVAPQGYHVGMGGVDTVSATLSGLESVPLCNDPVVISRRMENIDSGLERMELVFHRNGRWKTIIAPRADLLSKNSIIHYSDHGLPVNSCNSEGVVRYLTEYENENRSVIPFSRSINRIGWLNKEFYPYAVEQEIVFEDNAHTDLVRSLHECGDYGIWLETAGELRKNPFARTMLAASFASPMLEPLQNRVILLHCWHASRSGKTATLKFALSVWGDPIQLMGSFNSTAVGLERKAAILRNLPFGLDELQVLNERKLSPAQIVYSLGNGSGKTRGSRNGKLQETPTWRNCIICTGEQPISAENSMDGINTRVLELYGQPISDPEYGRFVHQVSESNYGFAGKRFIQFLQQNILSHRGKLRQDYALFRDALKDRFASYSTDPGVHLDNVAVLALADYYASLALFRMDETIAWEEALDMGISILTNAKSLEPQDSIERAWDFVKDWVASNRTKFTNMAPECFGLIEGQCVYALSNKLRQALESAGFSYTKSIKGFRERGYLVVTTDSDGKERNQCQKRIQGVNTRAFCLNIPVTPAEFDEDDFLGASA